MATRHRWIAPAIVGSSAGGGAALNLGAEVVAVLELRSELESRINFALQLGPVRPGAFGVVQLVDDPREFAVSPTLTAGQDGGLIGIMGLLVEEARFPEMLVAKLPFGPGQQ